MTVKYLWLFVAIIMFCGHVVWHALKLVIACFVFKDFFIKMIMLCVPLSFSGFFLLQCGNFTVFLIFMNSVQLKPDTQNVLSVTMLKFPRLGAESKQHFKNITLKK